jgi:hypothetical protein
MFIGVQGLCRFTTSIIKVRYFVYFFIIVTVYKVVKIRESVFHS